MEVARLLELKNLSKKCQVYKVNWPNDEFFCSFEIPPTYCKLPGLTVHPPRSHRPFRFEHWWTRPNFFEMYSRNIDKSLYLNEIWIYGPLFCTLFLPGFEPGTSRVAAGSANHYTNVERAGRAKKLLIMKFCATCHSAGLLMEQSPKFWYLLLHLY